MFSGYGHRLCVDYPVVFNCTLRLKCFCPGATGREWLFFWWKFQKRIVNPGNLLVVNFVPAGMGWSRFGETGTVAATEPS